MSPFLFGPGSAATSYPSRDPFDEYDPYVHDRRDEPPELTDDDYCRSLFDATTGEFFDA